MRRAISFTIGRGFSKTSLPKLTVPVVRVAMSGRSAPVRVSGPQRSSTLIPTAPPVEVWIRMSHLLRTARIAARNSSADCEGLPSAVRTWRWIIEAPASRHRAASSAISSAVIGRYGVCSRLVSAPTIAAVMT